MNSSKLAFSAVNPKEVSHKIVIKIEFELSITKLILIPNVERIIQFNK